MAGSQNIGEASDNPVGINVVPMVDVIFCLCLFFMCSLKFKQLEGRIETWLPKHGQVGEVDPPLFDQIRVSLKWDPETGRTVRKVGARRADSDLDFEEALNLYPKKLGLAVAVDATVDVPWRDAVAVLDLCRRNRFEKIEFVEPWQPAAR